MSFSLLPFEIFLFPKLNSYVLFLSLELSQKKGYYDVGTAKAPDVYFEPKVVWEVLAADLSLSPVYSAARGESPLLFFFLSPLSVIDILTTMCLCVTGLCGDRGISLRLPRLMRIRDDKDAESSTEPEQVRGLPTTLPFSFFLDKG